MTTTVVVAELSALAAVAVVAVDAAIAVLQPKPVFVVQINAEADVEQVPTANAVGEAVPAVALPRTVFVAWVATSPSVTRPVAVKEPVTVRPASVPTLVSDEVTTFEASVVPVNEPAAAAPAAKQFTPDSYKTRPPTVAQTDPATVPTVESDAAVNVLFRTVAPVTVSDASVPTDVRDEAVTPLARVAPVRPLAGTAAAVIVVLQLNPVPLVQSNALAAVEHDGTARPEGLTAVSAPRTVFAV